MLTVLTVSNHAALRRFTGRRRGLLVAGLHHLRGAAVGHEHEPGAHASGPALVGGAGHGLWLYFVAPPLGMLLAAEIYVRLARRVARSLRQAAPRARRAASSAATARLSLHHGGHVMTHRRTTTSSSSAPARAAARWRTASRRRASGSCSSSAATTCRARRTTGTRAPSTSTAKYHTKESWHDKDGKPLHPHTNYYVGGNTKFYGAALFRLRERGLRRAAPPRRRLAGLADLVRRPRAVLHAGRASVPRARRARRGPDRAAGERAVSAIRPSATSRASSSCTTTSRGRAAGRSTCRSASCSTRRTRRRARASAARPATASRAWCTPSRTRR